MTKYSRAYRQVQLRDRYQREPNSQLRQSLNTEENGVYAEAPLRREISS